MSDATNSKSDMKGGFWTTLPGILSQLAILIPTITGLIMALNQTGLFKTVSLPFKPSIKSSSFSTRLLTDYARSLTDREFATLGRIYPKGNEDMQKKWLEGTSKDSRIVTVQVVGQPERSDSENEVTLRATMQYCRYDQSGSTDIKNYTFVKNQGTWQLDSMTAPEKVKNIHC
jgi:hypothetical protein